MQFVQFEAKSFEVNEPESESHINLNSTLRSSIINFNQHVNFFQF